MIKEGTYVCFKIFLDLVLWKFNNMGGVYFWRMSSISGNMNSISKRNVYDEQAHSFAAIGNEASYVSVYIKKSDDYYDNWRIIYNGMWRYESCVE